MPDKLVRMWKKATKVQSELFERYCCQGLYNNDGTKRHKTKGEYMSIDYKKLLTRCMEKWIDAEGGCWDGDSDATITNHNGSRSG